MKKAEEGYTIKDLIVQFSRFVKKSRWIFTGGVILGVIAGFLLNSREKVYTSEVIIGSTQIPSNTLTEFVNNSKFNSTTNNSCELVVEDIRAMSLDESNYESIAKFNVIEATIEITNRGKAEDYWSCLLNQLNEMKFISKLHGQNQVLLNEELQAINVQIEKLTKLQNSYQEIVDEQKWNAPIGIFNNSSQTEMLELLKHKKEIKTQLFIDSKLHIISDVRVDPNPINGPIKSYSIGLLGVLFLSFIVSLVADLRRSI